MAAVDIIRAKKFYGDFCALYGISVFIPDGEFLVLVGPSGCGKSTLLRMIAGLETVDGGEIKIGPTVVNDLAPKERDVAMVFQNYALYPHMNVFDNMAFSLKIKHMKRTEINERVTNTAAILGLGDLLERYPRQLSGGQRQRVAMGRAIVRAPQVFLFDEPLSNLDAKLRVQMRAEIKELHQRIATTSIYVTHDQVEAMTLADRIVVMNDGKIEQVGSPLELYDTPKNVFVAGFIGSPAMNIFKGTAQIADGIARVKIGDDVYMPIPDGVSVEDGMAVAYGIRPENLSIANGRAGLPAEVNVVEPTGAETIVYCRAAGADICVQFFDRPNLKPGDAISLVPHDNKAHVFSLESGDRIVG